MPFLSTIRCVLFTLISLFVPNTTVPLDDSNPKPRRGKGKKPPGKKTRAKALVMPLELLADTVDGRTVLSTSCTKIDDDLGYFAATFPEDVRPDTIRFVSVKHTDVIGAIAPLTAPPVAPETEPDAPPVPTPSDLPPS